MTKPSDHILAGLDYKYMKKSELEAQIKQFASVAKAGLRAKTQGIMKLAEAELRKSLDDFREHSEMGIYHKEQLAVLSVDIRGSSRLAIDQAPESVFFAIQCFLPLMAHIVVQASGEIISLRGDGLIAGFGFGIKHWEPCINDAYECGMLMILATRDILNPMLAHYGIPVQLSVGVGIDCGKIVVTKIGLGKASEITAYGEAVNTAAKNSKGTNNVWLSANTCKKCPMSDRSLAVPMIWTPGRQRIL